MDDRLLSVAHQYAEVGLHGGKGRHVEEIDSDIERLANDGYSLRSVLIKTKLIAAQPDARILVPPNSRISILKLLEFGLLWETEFALGFALRLEYEDAFGFVKLEKAQPR